MIVRLIVVAVMAVTLGSTAYASEKGQAGGGAQLQGDRTVIGTVKEVRSNEIKVDIGDIEPRFLPLKPEKEKGLPPFKPGDKIAITVNGENLLVDYHRPGEGGHHRIVKGRLADKLVIGHDQALIETADGKKQEYEVRSQVRSKMAGLKTGEEAEFLIDEANQIADVTFSKEVAKDMSKDLERQAFKGAHRRVDVTVISPLNENKIQVRTGDGKVAAYEVRPLVKDKLTKVGKGDSITLLVDNEGKVIDVAYPPKG
ncbi:MAG TPA: hypothetical protein VFA38_03345 [Nitrospirales bacterium]|nr:hypothetical protein [Nitrospirales bacterium]